MLAFEPASRPGTRELAARLQRCSPEARSVRRTRAALAVATALVLGMSALFALQPIAIQNAALNAAPDKSIAVLPFENRSEDKANAYFADGIQDEILTRLSKIADLKVISRTSTQHYKSASRKICREIAKQLGVAHILEGSVQKSGDSVRVNVQLIKAATDSHVWADTFDRKLTDILSVESEVAKAIAEQLRATLTGQEEQLIAAKPTDNPEAYDAYLRGLAYTLKDGRHPRAIPWRTEISQRSGAVGSQVRPCLGAAVIHGCNRISSQGLFNQPMLSVKRHGKRPKPRYLFSPISAKR